MSIKRVASSVPMDLWLPADVTSVITFCEVVLQIFRDEGARGDRQKARLMWLIEEKGMAQFRSEVVEKVVAYGRGITIDKEQPEGDGQPFTRRETLGIHKQPIAGKSRVGVHVPTGRLSVAECRAVADLADKYSGGEVRLTVEQNIILPNVDDDKVDSLCAEPALNGGRLSVFPGKIASATVSCTGSQFCGLALIETKATAERMANKLDASLNVPKPVRIHWTGCPNSCGQVQAGEIGIMGAPAKKFDPESGKNKAAPG